MRVNMLGSDFRYDRSPSYARRTGRNVKSATMAGSFRYQRAPSYSRKSGRLGYSYDAKLQPDFSPLYDGSSKEEEVIEKAVEEKKEGGPGEYVKELAGIIVREGVEGLMSKARTPEQRAVVKEAEQQVMTRNLLIGGGIAAAAVTLIVIAKK